MKDYIAYGMDELMIDGHRCKKLIRGSMKLVILTSYRKIYGRMIREIKGWF